MTTKQSIWAAVTCTLTAMRPKGYSNLVPIKILARWVMRTHPNQVVQALKAWAFEYRQWAVTGKKPEIIPDVPRCVQNFIKGHTPCHQSRAQFARLSRALPRPTQKVVRRALQEWATRVSEDTTGDLRIAQQVFEFGRKFARENKHLLGREISWQPSNMAASATMTAAAGGRLQEAIDDAREILRPAPSSRLVTDGRRFTFFRDEIPESESAWGTGVLPSNIVREAIVDTAISKSMVAPIRPVVHALPEFGGKVRVITTYPNFALTPGDIIRSQVWPMIENQPWCDADKVPSKQKYQQLLKQSADKFGAWVSSDLTAATDYIPHLYCRMLWEGILLELNAPSWCSAYTSRMFSPMVVRDRKGKMVCTMARGSPMGTPLSFATLSLLHRYAVERAGIENPVLIRGDDFIGLLPKPEKYFREMERIGFQINRKKTFITPHGGTFAERTFVCQTKRFRRVGTAVLSATVLEDIPLKGIVHLDDSDYHSHGPRTRSKLVKIGAVYQGLKDDFSPKRRMMISRLLAIYHGKLILQARSAGVPVSLPVELGGAGIPAPHEARRRVLISFDYRRTLGRVLSHPKTYRRFQRIVRRAHGDLCPADRGFLDIIDQRKPSGTSVPTFQPFASPAYGLYKIRELQKNPFSADPCPKLSFGAWARSLRMLGKVRGRWAVSGDVETVARKLMTAFVVYVPYVPGLQGANYTLGPKE